MNYPDRAQNVLCDESFAYMINVFRRNVLSRKTNSAKKSFAQTSQYRVMGEKILQIFANVCQNSTYVSLHLSSYTVTVAQ